MLQRPANLGQVVLVDQFFAVAISNIERIDDVVAQRLHFGAGEVEIQLAQGTRQEIQQTDPVRRCDLDNRRGRRRLVVDGNAGFDDAFRGACTDPVGIGLHPLGYPSCQCDSAAECTFDALAKAIPVNAILETRLEPEHGQRDAELRMRSCVENCQPVERDGSGNSAEHAWAVDGHHGEQLALALDADGAPTHRLAVLFGREVPGELAGIAAFFLFRKKAPVEQLAQGPNLPTTLTPVSVLAFLENLQRNGQLSEKEGLALSASIKSLKDRSFGPSRDVPDTEELQEMATRHITPLQKAG